MRDIELHVLMVCDRRSKFKCKHLVLEKGVGHPWAAAVLLKDLERPGHPKVTMKSDQGRPLNALAQPVKNVWSREIILEGSAVGDGDANGEVERPVR